MMNECELETLKLGLFYCFFYLTMSGRNLCLNLCCCICKPLLYAKLIHKSLFYDTKFLAIVFLYMLRMCSFLGVWSRFHS